jgi:hypothetical protein
MTAKEEICDVCHGESRDSRYVGVAAVPSAPVSVAWCRNCLYVGAIPRFVAEAWLLGDLVGDGPLRIPKKPPRKFPLATWAGETMIWLGPVKEYVALKDCWKILWKHVYVQQHREG